jgi:hypothetical protein
VAGTLADMATQSTNPFERGVIQKFKQTSDWIEVCPYKTIQGQVYRYRVEEVQPGISWRDVNAAYPESTGVIAPRVESTMIVGGDIFLDNALLNTARSGGDAIDYQQSQYSMKARSLAREIERASFEGDDLSNPAEMMGLRARLSGTQVIYAGTGGAGAALTLAHMDALLDALDLSIGQAHLWMSKADRRALTRLVTSATGSVNYTFTTLNDAGKVIESYYGVPIHIVEDGWDAATILGKDEDAGNGTANTSSIYATIFDETMGVCGLLSGGDGSPLVDVREVGETTSGPPGIMGRIEVYPGMMIKSPRAASRLRGVL